MPRLPAVALVAAFAAAAPLTTQQSQQVQAAWSVKDLTNEFGETVGRAAVSKWTAPAVLLSPPYDDVTARIVVSDDSVYLEFTHAPNLVGGSTADGFTWHRIGSRWDGVPVGQLAPTAMVSQTWGANTLNYYYDKRVLRRLERHGELAVSLHWYGIGRVGWKFSLEGASEAIQSARE